jgi:hypothetical protein
MYLALYKLGTFDVTSYIILNKSIKFQKWPKYWGIGALYWR